MHICYKACRIRKMKFLIERVNYWYKLGTFYITISVHRIINVKYFPKELFLIGNFPNVQSTKRQLPMSISAAALGPPLVLVAGLGTLAAALGPHCSLRCLRGPNPTFGKLPLGKLHIWELPLGKLSPGKSPLGQCLWESTCHRIIRLKKISKMFKLIYIMVMGHYLE